MLSMIMIFAKDGNSEDDVLQKVVEIMLICNVGEDGGWGKRGKEEGERE